MRDYLKKCIMALDQIKIVSDSSDIKHYEQEETKEVLGFTKTPAFNVS